MEGVRATGARTWAVVECARGKEINDPVEGEARKPQRS